MTESPITPVSRNQIHPGWQFLTLIGLLVLALFIGSIIAIAVIVASYGMDTFTNIAQANYGAPHIQNALWILQFFGTTTPILITPLIFSHFIVKEPDAYIKSSFNFSWILIVLAFAIMLLSNPMIELLSNINQKMALPPFLKGIENWMRKSENDTKKISDLMMQMNTIWGMFFNLVFIGLLTAIVEETLFRGCLQTILICWMKNKHVAIWTTAILFSAFHMEFFGFLPRLLLGLLFGYFTLWSGSILPSIWAHFINNGSVVVITYLSQRKLININIDDAHVFNYTGYIISFIITLFLLLLYRTVGLKKQTASIDGTELG